MNRFNPEYFSNSRDAAWKILIGSGITLFPLDSLRLIEDLHIDLMTYKDAEKVMPGIELKVNSPTYSIISEDENTIFYDDISDENILRISLAHELGHIVLGHSKNDKNSFQEEDADIFALRLTMPTIVIHSENLLSPDEISGFFGIPIEFAQRRFKRYQTIKEREMLLTNPLEKQYYDIYSSRI